MKTILHVHYDSSRKRSCYWSSKSAFWLSPADVWQDDNFLSLYPPHGLCGTRWDLCAAIHLVTIYGKTESVYVQKFHCSINGTLSSGKLPESLTYKCVVCAYFANSFVDQSVQISRMKTRYFPAMALCIRHEPLPSSISATDPTRSITHWRPYPVYYRQLKISYHTCTSKNFVPGM